MSELSAPEAPSDEMVYHEEIELIHAGFPAGQIRYALFDFDGTLSLIREGWQDVMIPMMVELLLATPHHESEAELTKVVRRFVSRLTGKQTIFQMIQLCDELRERGGEPQEPLVYKWEYLQRLGERIEGRITGLRSGRLAPDDLMVPGSRDMLEALSSRGVTCFLASGTDERFVLDEAEALKIAHFFSGIHGAQDDYLNFSKKLVIERILAQNGLRGPELVAFGDGFVEIEDTKAAGGIAVGVASDEANRQGIDAWKRTRLIEAGADLIVPDFRSHRRLLATLFAEE